MAGRWARPLTVAEMDDLSALSFRQFREAHGANYHAWRQLRDRFSLDEAKTDRLPREAPRSVPLAEPPALPKELAVAERKVLLAADWHVPHHSEALVNRLDETAGKLDVHHLVINGDFCNEDAFFMGGMDKHPGTTPFAVELAKMRELLDYLLDTFERIFWTRGNHEERLFRVNKWEVSMDLLLEMVGGSRGDRVVVTDRDYLIVAASDPEYNWRVTHGVGGSASVATSAAVRKAEILLTNVAQGHDHLLGLRQTANGRYWGMDTGCMLEPAWAGYKALNTKPYPVWNQGFALLDNGRPTLFGPRLNEWT
jgi:hypothetical protein